MVRLHIFLVADGRSPITHRWVKGLTALEYTVTLASTFPCQPVAGVQAQHVLPVAFGWLAGNQVGRTAAHHPGSWQQIVGRFRNLFMKWRYSLAP
ncbi:MAG: hypothetical protein U1B80_03320, partial [Anaerolineaceae bacterium]|nr:hypothetical protein [Anaerolineaceae bacterium]